MRLLLKFESKRGMVLPFDYQDALRSTLHRWLGQQNKEHDSRSFYGFSNLLNLCAAGRRGLVQRPETTTVDWFVGFHEAEVANRFIRRASQLRYHFADLTLAEIAIQPELAELPDTFRVLSPVLVKVRAGLAPRVVVNKSSFDHLLPSDPDHAAWLTRSFRNKLAAANLDPSSCELHMAEPFQTKLIKIKDTLNRCAVSPVTILGTDEQKRFARNCGVGHSTGCGFGFLA